MGGGGAVRQEEGGMIRITLIVAVLGLLLPSGVASAHVFLNRRGQCFRTRPVLAPIATRNSDNG